MGHDSNYYVKVEGDHEDSIEGWAETVGMTLEEALEEGVCSPDNCDPYVLVPMDLFDALYKSKTT